MRRIRSFAFDQAESNNLRQLAMDSLQKTWEAFMSRT
jgi:hypothetical protein